MRVKVASRFERFITFITIVGSFTAVRLEVPVEEVLTLEQFATVGLRTHQADRVVSGGPVVGQAVGGGELPVAVRVVTAEDPHLLQVRA